MFNVPSILGEKAYIAFIKTALNAKLLEPEIERGLFEIVKASFSFKSLLEI